MGPTRNTLLTGTRTVAASTMQAADQASAKACISKEKEIESEKVSLPVEKRISRKSMKICWNFGHNFQIFMNF